MSKDSHVEDFVAREQALAREADQPLDSHARSLQIVLLLRKCGVETTNSHIWQLITRYNEDSRNAIANFLYELGADLEYRELMKAKHQ